MKEIDYEKLLEVLTDLYDAVEESVPSHIRYDKSNGTVLEEELSLQEAMHEAGILLSKCSAHSRSS